MNAGFQTRVWHVWPLDARSRVVARVGIDFKSCAASGDSTVCRPLRSMAQFVCFSSVCAACVSAGVWHVLSHAAVTRSISYCCTLWPTRWQFIRQVCRAWGHSRKHDAWLLIHRCYTSCNGLAGRGGHVPLRALSLSTELTTFVCAASRFLVTFVTLA